MHIKDPVDHFRGWLIMAGTKTTKRVTVKKKRKK